MADCLRRGDSRVFQRHFNETSSGPLSKEEIELVLSLNWSLKLNV